VLSRRSGALSRFLVFRAPEYWAIRGEFFAANILVGWLAFFGAVLGFSSCGGAAALAQLDPQDPIHRLAEPLSPGEAARGGKRLSGRIAGAEVCLVTHEVKRKDWAEDWHGTYGEGASILIDRAEGSGAPRRGESQAIAWSTAEWGPRLALQESTRSSTWRQRFPSIPSWGRVLEGCLHRGDRVFVDIPPRSATTLTPGDGTPRPRLAELAASRAGRLSALALAVILVLLALWRLTGARPIAGALVRRLRQPLVPTASSATLAILAATPLVLVGGLWCASLLGVDGPVKIDRWGWVGAHSAVALTIVMVVLMEDRRVALGAAMRQIGPGTSPPLSRARDGEAFAIDATVDASAPLSPAPLSGKPRAHWVVGVTRVYRSGRNYASAAQPDVNGPLIVPISGDGGAALLDLDHAVADLRAVRCVARPRALQRGQYRDIVGNAWVAGSSYVLEERFLERGEPLYVIARVVRFELRDGHPGRLPVLGGTAVEPVVIHAGTRRSLLRGLAVERAFLSAALPLCIAVGVAMVGLSVYLVRL
jgi:hypothetical protein